MKTKSVRQYRHKPSRIAILVEGGRVRRVIGNHARTVIRVLDADVDRAATTDWAKLRRSLAHNL